RQLVRRLHRFAPGGGVGRQRCQPGHRAVRRHRRDAGLVGPVPPPAERTTAGAGTGTGMGLGRYGKIRPHRRGLSACAALRVRAGLSAGGRGTMSDGAVPGMVWRGRSMMRTRMSPPLLLLLLAGGCSQAPVVVEEAPPPPP